MVPQSQGYTKQDFDDFLQQTQLCGISKARQQELIEEHLQNDVTLWNIMTIIAQDILDFIKLHRKILLILLTLVCSVLLARWHVHSWNYAAAITRYVMIQTLVVFDWTQLFYVDCVVPNPFWSVDDPEHNCSDIQFELNVNHTSNLTGSFKELDLPLISKEGAAKWHKKNLTMGDLVEVVHSLNPDDRPCMFYVGEVEAPAYALTELMDGSLEDQSITMKGCTKLSNHMLRKLYRRPKILDADIEQLRQSTIFVSRAIPNDVVIEYNINADGGDSEIWIAQVAGFSHLTLKDLKCPQNQVVIEELLEAGDILFLDKDSSVQIELSGSQDNIVVMNDIETFDSE